MYDLNYACLLVPRFGTHHLTGDLSERLSKWMPNICIAFGWRLEHLSVRPDYLQWVVNVPPTTSPGYLMRIMRKQTSNKIFMEDLFKLIKVFEDNGIQLGLQFDSFLITNELKDFIVYGDFSVLTEGRQADENYKKASSIINFNTIHLKKHLEVFENVWSKSNTSPSSIDILKKFKLFYEDENEYTKELFNNFIKENYNEYYN